MAGFLLSLGLLASGAMGFFAGGGVTGRGRSPAAGAAGTWVDLLYPMAVAFFAGFVFSTLVPHALEVRARWLPFLAGVAVMGILSKLVFKRDPCCEAGHDHHGFGAVSLLAMAVCSLNDGLLIGLILPPLWSGLNLGMLLHKVTSSFAAAQVLLRSGFRGPGLAAFGLAYVLVSPLALLAARSPLAAALDADANEMLLAFSAGLLAYVTLASMVPHAYGILRLRPRSAYGFAAALTLSVGLGLWHATLHAR